MTKKDTYPLINPSLKNSGFVSKLFPDSKKPQCGGFCALSSMSIQNWRINGGRDRI
jgi:hypothetical protein